MKYYRRKITAIVSCDLNDLKVINDNEGHLFGDMALEVVSNHIISSCPKEALVYRIGGDEFSIICVGLAEDKIKSIIEDIRDKVKKSSYSMAIGYAMLEPNEEINQLVTRADAKMYEDKARIKNFVDTSST